MDTDRGFLRGHGGNGERATEADAEQGDAKRRR